MSPSIVVHTRPSGCEACCGLGFHLAEASPPSSGCRPSYVLFSSAASHLVASRFVLCCEICLDGDMRQDPRVRLPVLVHNHAWWTLLRSCTAKQESVCAPRLLCLLVGNLELLDVPKESQTRCRGSLVLAWPQGVAQYNKARHAQEYSAQEVFTKQCNFVDNGKDPAQPVWSA